MFADDPRVDWPENVLHFRSLLLMPRQPIGDESGEPEYRDVVYDATNDDHSIKKLQPALSTGPLRHPPFDVEWQAF